MRVFLVGTRGRTRTGTLFLATDFESVVSTNFTTLALRVNPLYWLLFIPWKRYSVYFDFSQMPKCITC
jgi:hypothetical protein